MKKFIRKRWKLLLIIADILLALAICALMFLQTRRVRNTSANLARAAASISGELEERENTAASGSADGTESMAEDSDFEDGQGDQMNAGFKLSFRGDAFSIPGGDSTTDVASKLQMMLDADGANVEVQNYTLDGANALTQLYYAGVPEEEINAFIEKNRASGKVNEADENEFSIGDVSNISLVRNDVNSVPVLFIGNNGGWGRDPYQLIDIQQRIIDTYNCGHRFFVIGNYYKGSDDPENVDAIMKAYWGWHYISCPGVATGVLNTVPAHDRLAERIVETLRANAFYTPNPQMGQ